MKLLAGLALLSALSLGSAGHSHELAWLVGCWVSPDRRAQEVWVLDSDKSLAGFGVALNDNQVGFYEVLSIRKNKHGVFVYTAHPSGQRSATFAATTLTTNSVVFTNPDHDYPQEIKYTREDNRLHAITSLLGGANPNSFEKIACD